jgi:hypothetical protein
MKRAATSRGTDPNTVVAPQTRSMLREVFHGATGWSQATGKWDGQRTLGCRWNGDANHPPGRPVSRAIPIWFILPGELWRPILTLFAATNPESAMAWLSGDDAALNGARRNRNRNIDQ